MIMTAAITPTTTSSTVYQPTPLVVPNTSAGALSSIATDLASQSAIVASLGGGAGVSLYTPSGLFNSLQQAGATSTAATTAAVGSSTSAAGSATSTTGTAASGTSSSAGTPATGDTSDSSTATAPTPQQLADTSSNWSTILKTNPELAGTVISSSFDQGIVASLNVTA